MARRPGNTQNAMDPRTQARRRPVPPPLPNPPHLREHEGQRRRAAGVGIKADGAYQRGDYSEDLLWMDTYDEQPSGDVG